MSAPEDNLPPVQPPSAGFLVQLFVVPMVIVVVIVMVCLMFNWLAHLGTQPRDLANDLARLNAGSWQKALTIANMLTDRRNQELRQDQQLAATIGGYPIGRIGGGRYDTRTDQAANLSLSSTGGLRMRRRVARIDRGGPGTA